MTKSVLHTLTHGRANIERPEWWAKGFYAFDKNGVMRNANDADATCFCTLGAIRATGDSHELRSEAELALRAAVPHSFSVKHGLKDSSYVSIPAFNDDKDTTHEQVLALFDTAIAAVAAQQKEAN